MNPRITDLMRVMRQEIGLYQELIEHAQRKTGLLIQGRLEPILESNKVDETISIKLRMMEDEMVRLCHSLCQDLQIPQDQFTLLKLTEGLEPPIAEEIESQTRFFRKLLEQLRGITLRNTRLIESSLSYSRGLLDFISNATSSYQGTGRFRPLSAVQTISRQA